MQATILEPLSCPQLVCGHRLRSSVLVRAKSARTVSSPLKTRFPCIKSNALSIPSANINTRKNNYPLHILQDSSVLPRRGPHPPRVLKDIISSAKSQPVEKPEWWWRTLACIPYLMNFYDHRAWAYAYPTRNVSPFLKAWESHTFPLFFAICHLPNFILSGYAVLCYFGIVRQKRWPRFLRLHVMTSVLMGSALQIIGVVSGWCPSWFFPPHFWFAASIVFLLTEMYCMGCALRGKCPDIPLVSDAAYLHTDLRLR